MVHDDAEIFDWIILQSAFFQNPTTIDFSVDTFSPCVAISFLVCFYNP